MPHAQHNARRIKSTAVTRVPVANPQDPRKDMKLGAAVGFSMLIITGLYAATFRYQMVALHPEKEYPRWSALTEDVASKTAPLKRELAGVKDTITAFAQASHDQNAAVAAMKIAIENSATATTETP